MHEEFQSNRERAKDQYKRSALCHSKVVLKDSMIVTCYFLGEEREVAGAERGNYGALFSW